jgi:sigma-E factor negative regulatory protein RseC
MIEEQAIVVGVERDQALLEIIRSKPCGLCGQTRGCGVSIWGRLLGHRNSVLRVANHINAQAGDSVIVGVDEKALLASSLTAYGVPLLFLLVGAASMGAFAPASGHVDVYALLGAGIGLVLGLFLVHGLAGGRGLDVLYRPVILRQADVLVNIRKCHRGD